MQFCAPRIVQRLRLHGTILLPQWNFAGHDVMWISWRVEKCWSKPRKLPFFCYAIKPRLGQIHLFCHLEVPRRIVGESMLLLCIGLVSVDQLIKKRGKRRPMSQVAWHNTFAVIKLCRSCCHLKLLMSRVGVQKCCAWIGLFLPCHQAMAWTNTFVWPFRGSELGCPRKYAHTVHGNGCFCRPIEESGVYLILIDHKTSLAYFALLPHPFPCRSAEGSHGHTYAICRAVGFYWLNLVLRNLDLLVWFMTKSV